LLLQFTGKGAMLVATSYMVLIANKGWSGDRKRVSQRQFNLA